MSAPVLGVATTIRGDFLRREDREVAGADRFVASGAA